MCKQSLLKPNAAYGAFLGDPCYKTLIALKKSMFDHGVNYQKVKAKIGQDENPETVPMTKAFNNKYILNVGKLSDGALAAEILKDFFEQGPNPVMPQPTLAGVRT